MDISTTTLQHIKLHYTEEYQKTLRKLKDLEAVLQELSQVDVSVLDLENISSINNTQTTSKENILPAASNIVPKRSYKKRAKKRGRKSLWGEFVLKRLKAINRPLTYDALANHALVTMGLQQSEYDKTRKSLIAAVFQLRNKQQKVNTANKTGTRDKYVLLSKWTDGNGNPLPEFGAYIE